MKKLLFMLAVLVSMLNPTVGWATTFIKDVAVSIDTDEKKAKNALKNNGYTVVDTDLNAGCGSGSYYVYVGYTTTTKAAEAITDLIIAHNYSPSSDSFTWSYTGKFYRIATNVLENGNLNRGQGSGSANLWLYYSKTGNTTNGQSLVTSIYGHIGASSSSEYLVGVTSSTAKPEGSIDLNMGAGGKYVYLGQKKEHTHSFSYWDYTTDSHQYGCASCNYVKSTAAHNWDNSGVRFQAKTCTAAEVHYQTCTTCGRTNDANHTYTIGNALGHSFDEVNDPHHTNCTRCKHTFFRYKSGEGQAINPYKNNFGGAQILSNTYTNGEGVIEFDRKLTTIGDSAFIYRYGFWGDLVIPNSVTSIGNYAFTFCSAFNGKLVIPNTVTSIGDYAFDQCSGLTGKLVIPNTVKSIGEYAFEYCTGFTGVEIPNSVTRIGVHAFANCQRFSGKLVIPNSVTSIGDYAFYNCKGLTGVEIPNSVTSIESGVFRDCTGFTGVVIPNSVTRIGYSAFQDCIGLTGDLVIPNSVTSIAYYAFYGCTKLENVLFLGNKSISMAPGIFGNDNLTLYVKDLSKWDTNEKYGADSLTYKTLKEYCEEVIGHHDLDKNCVCNFCSSKEHTFAAEDTRHHFCTHCEHTFFRYHSKDNKVESYTRDNFGNAYVVSNTYTNGEGVIEFDCKLTTIGFMAFYYCRGFTDTLEIPNTVTSIDQSAFHGCSGFTGVEIPNSVTSIGISAFEGCTGFTGDLVIPNSVKSIGYSAFKGCSGFTGELEISNSVASIEAYTFSECSGFTGDLVIPNSVRSIGDYAFSECSGFSGKLVIPNSVTSIGKHVFANCAGLTSVVIPNSVKSIGYSAFDGCSGLTSMEIPSTVTSVGNFAFRSCSQLKYVIFLRDKPTMATNAFTGDSLSLYVKDLSKWNTNEKYGADSLTYKTWKEYCEEVIGEHDQNKNCACNFCGRKEHTFAAEDTLRQHCAQCNHSFFRYHSKDNKEIVFYEKNFGDANVVSNTYTNGEGVFEFDRPLTTIGDRAFYNRTGFTGNLMIPNTVTSIGDEAFRFCRGFTGDLVIPNSVTSIGDNAFSSCTGFDGKLVIPNSVTSIGEYAFRSCTGLRDTLVIPNSVTSIEKNAFYECSGFTGKLEIPNSVTNIGEYAFGYCTGFTGVVIPNSVTSIGNYAFLCCSKLGHVVFLGNKPDAIGARVFYEDTLTLYVKDLSQWDTNEKYGAKRLTYKTLKEYCEVNGEHDPDENCSCSICGSKFHTFADEDKHHDFCTQCEHGFFRYQSEDGNVVKPANNNFGEAQIVSNTYAEGEGVIEFDRKLTTIGYRAFYKCYGLTGDLVIPNSVTSIGEDAFFECSGLTGNLVIPNSVTSIGNYAFSHCFGFTGDLVIPNSVTSIGEAAFFNCAGFTGDLVIPNSVTSIGEGAFYNCYGFTGDLEIPNSVTSIGNEAFAECYSLQSVEIASLPLFGEDAFYGVPCSISVALTDESYVCGEKEFDDSELPSLQSASYTRQMTNEWGTLVLPFGIDYLPENGNYRLYRLERVENQTLLLSEYAEGNIPAGTPVVVKAVGEKDSKGKYTLSIKQNAPTFDVNTEPVECDNNGWCMKGTLEPMTAAAGTQFYPAGMNVYYIAQNQFWHANQAFDMARFRAWFEAPASVDASAMRFQIMEVEETGIHTCAAGEKAESNFDLQGRRMSAPVKGLQIINGRKVLKK